LEDHQTSAAQSIEDASFPQQTAREPQRKRKRDKRYALYEEMKDETRGKV
jgi:hypothetical protein